MVIIGKGADRTAVDALVNVLQDAEEDDERLRDALGRPDCDTYTAHVGERLVGAAIIDRSAGRDPEILYIGIDEAFRRRGHGRELLGYLTAEAAAAGHRLIVGTGNSSLDNIAFYQRCGFRMDAIKRDYFDYVQPPVTEFGIELRDMIVFAFAASRPRPYGPVAN